MCSFLLRAMTALGVLVAASMPAVAEDADKRLAKGIQDNSFLIEEAYNQEAGVVQHIGNLRRQGHDWTLNFTQEWPIGTQKHQFSYSVPYSWIHAEENRFRGVGDVMLNYRYQMLEETATTPAFAPRFSVILPTGNEQKGLGDGAWGYQINLPFSKIVTDRVTLHFNAGMTSYFEDIAGQLPDTMQGQRPKTFNLGGSAIYAVTRDFNLMLEVVGEWAQSVTPESEIEREKSLTISPGFRYAINSSAGQLVVGLGAPIKFTKGDAPDYGAIFYLSFEHSFLK